MYRFFMWHPKKSKPTAWRRKKKYRRSPACLSLVAGVLFLVANIIFMNAAGSKYGCQACRLTSRLCLAPNGSAGRACCCRSKGSAVHTSTPSFSMDISWYKHPGGALPASSLFQHWAVLLNLNAFRLSRHQSFWNLEPPPTLTLSIPPLPPVLSVPPGGGEGSEGQLAEYSY